MIRFVASLRQTIWPQCIALVVLYLLGIATINGFGNWQSIVAILVLASFVGIAAAGQTVVALLGGIDLAIPGIIALANIATAELTGRGWPFWIVAPGILVLAALIGAANGLISMALKI
jgi:ribose transport system permease protein